MSQSSVAMPTTSPLPGLTFLNDLNPALAALITFFSGSSAPTTASTGLASTAGVYWHDTGNNLLFVRNQADSAWICLGAFDETNGRYVASEPNYLSGLTLSNDGTSPNTVIDVASGWAMDSGNAQPMIIGAFTKSISGSFTAGSGNNGMESGTTFGPTGGTSAGPWFHVHEIGGAGKATDIVISASATSPTMPSGYTLHRRIGSIKSDGSSHIVLFTQSGDEFILSVTVLDVNVTNLGTGTTAETLSVPVGVKVDALFRANVSNASVNVQVLLQGGDETAGAAGTNGSSLIVPTAGGNAAGQFSLRTTTAAKINAVAAAASTTLQIFTYGWIDTRGRLG